MSIYRELRFYGLRSVDEKKGSSLMHSLLLLKSVSAPVNTISPASSIPSTPAVPNAGQGLSGKMSGNNLINRLRNN